MAPASRMANGRWGIGDGPSRPSSALQPKPCASVRLIRSCPRNWPGAVASISSSRRRLGAKRASGTRPGPMQATTCSLCRYEDDARRRVGDGNACRFGRNAPASTFCRAGATARRTVGLSTTLRASRGARVERELARSGMGPGLVPLVPFGHVRRRDDDRGVQPLRAAVPVRKAGGVHSVGAAAQTCLAICPIPPTPTAAPCA
jgi:hypothetical protein